MMNLTMYEANFFIRFKKEIETIKKKSRQGKNLLNENQTRILLKKFHTIGMKYLEEIGLTKYRLALEVALTLVEEGGILFDYGDDSGVHLREFLQVACDLVEEVLESVGGVSEEEKLILLQMVINRAQSKSFDGKQYYRFMLLDKGLCLVSSKACGQLFLNLVNDYMKVKNYFNSALMLKLEVLRRLQRYDEMETLLTENSHNEFIRQWQVLEALQQEKFEKAKELAIKGKKLAPKSEKAFWDQILRENEKPSPKQQETKDSVGDEKLNVEIHEVVLDISKQMNQPEIVKISLEKMVDKAGTQVVLNKIKADRSLIEYCPKEVVRDFPKEVKEIFGQYLLNEAKKAKTRVAYKKLCKKINHSIDIIGESFAKEVTHHLQFNYKNKTALLDELNNLWQNKE